MFCQLIVNGLVVGSGYALISIGHTFIFGLMHIVNFAHGELYMLGAFLTLTFVSYLSNLNYFISLIIAMLIAVIFAIIIEKTMIKKLIDKDELTTALITIGLSIFLQNVAQLIWGANPRSFSNPFQKGSLQLGSVFITRPRLFILIIAIIIIYILHLFIMKTKIGKAFRATFQNREAALMSGIDITRIYTISYSLGSLLAALAGGLLGLIYIIEPTMGIRAVGKAFVIVIVASRASFVGAITVGYALGIIESLGSAYISSEYKDVFAFIVVISILLFKPEGLFGVGRSK